MEEYYLTFTNNDEKLLNLHVFHENHFTKKEMYKVVKESIDQCFKMFGKELNDFTFKHFLLERLSEDFGFHCYQKVNIYEYVINNNLLYVTQSHDK